MISLQKKQQGLALLMLVFVLILVAMSYVISFLDSGQVERLRKQKTALALAEAKAALIGWSVGHPNFPGTLPFPDRSQDGNYDGRSDCPQLGVRLNDGLFIGRLPQVGNTAPCVGVRNYGLSVNLEDGHGERLWYAVSRNLVRRAGAFDRINNNVVPGAPRINPVMPDASLGDWLVVRDKNGQPVRDSNGQFSRVAAVIIAPGPPIGGQNRAGGLAGPEAYLDNINMSSGAIYSNNNGDVAFILGEDAKYVSITHPAYQQPYQYNDRLIFITRDELMEALQRRAVREAANALRAYYAASDPNDPTNRFYPYAAALGDESNTCVDNVENSGLGLQVGLLPTGGGCNNQLLGLPPWFTENQWQHHIYYAISDDCTAASPGCLNQNEGITVGTQTNVDALLIETGAPITIQVTAENPGDPTERRQTRLLGGNRLSENILDYLDSAENTNEDLVFDAAGTPITGNYNDQMFIVAP